MTMTREEWAKIGLTPSLGSSNPDLLRSRRCWTIHWNPARSWPGRRSRCSPPSHRARIHHLVGSLARELLLREPWWRPFSLIGISTLESRHGLHSLFDIVLLVRELASVAVLALTTEKVETELPASLSSFGVTLAAIRLGAARLLGSRASGTLGRSVGTLVVPLTFTLAFLPFLGIRRPLCLQRSKACLSLINKLLGVIPSAILAIALASIDLAKADPTKMFG